MWCYLLQPGICSAERVLLACKKQRKEERIAKSGGVCPVPCLFHWPVPAARYQSLMLFGVFLAQRHPGDLRSLLDRFCLHLSLKWVRGKQSVRGGSCKPLPGGSPRPCLHARQEAEQPPRASPAPRTAGPGLGGAASGRQQMAAAPQARQRGRAGPAGLRRLRERSAALPARGTAPAALPGPALPCPDSTRQGYSFGFLHFSLSSLFSLLHI